MALEISDVVNVSAEVRAGGVSRDALGSALFLTRDASVLSAGGAGKVRAYNRLKDVEADFAAGTEPRLAATAYFGQQPRPGPLRIGRWANAIVNSILTGGAPATVTAIRGVTDGSITVGGILVDNLDFSTPSTYSAQAAVLQTALQAETDTRLTNATVTYNNGVFNIDFMSTGDLGDPPVTAGTAGTDAATLLGLTAAAGAVYKQGSDAETIEGALSTIEGVDGAWYFLGLEKSLHGTQSILDAGAWVNARRKSFAAASAENAALTTGEQVSFAARLMAMSYQRVTVTFSRVPDYKCMSIVGALASTRFDQPNSVRTAMFRTLFGFVADTYSATEIAELRRKRINYYTGYSGDPIYAEGWTGRAGIWWDVQYWLDWLVNAIETDVWNALKAQPRIPLTNAGMQFLNEKITNVLEQGVTNGGIAPGTTSVDFQAEIRRATNNEGFDGVLSTGYLVHIGELSAQSQADRDTRMSPPISVWLKGSGAIHQANITLSFEN